MTEKYVATEERLREEMLEFERQFGLDSFEIRRLHAAGEAPEQVPAFERMVWIDTVERWEWVRERKQRASSSAR